MLPPMTGRPPGIVGGAARGRSPGMSEAKRVPPAEAKRLMDDEGWVYVDVRSEPEFDAGHPAGAYNVPISRATGPEGALQPNPDFLRVMEATFPKDTKIVLGCRSGGRSLKALGLLEEHGFTSLVDQRAGFHGPTDAFGQRTEDGWGPAGLPAATTAEPGRDYPSLLSKAD